MGCCAKQEPYIQCNNSCTGYPEPHCGGGFGGYGPGGGYGNPGGHPGGNGGYYQAPPPPAPTWQPIPMQAQFNGGGDGLMAVARELAGQVGSYAAEQLENRRLCGPWKTDGVYEHKLCCTPSVGRYGVKVAACVKLTRPYNPWAGSRIPLGLTPGNYPGYPPIG